MAAIRFITSRWRSRKTARCLAISDKIIADMGSTYTVDHSIQAAALYMTGVYQIQNYEVTAFGMSTNKTTHGSLRGIGKADASYILERLVDIAARELKMDPIDIRMKNFIPADAFPYRNATGALYDSGQYHLAMKRTAEIAGYEQLRKEQTELRKQGHLSRHRRRAGDGADQLEPHSRHRRLCVLPPAHRSYRRGDGFFQHGRARART